MPKVVIVTPTYNRGDNGLLVKTMASVLAQTYVDFAYLVVDDDSTDSTPRVVEEAAKRDPRIVYMKREREPGRIISASFARNHGIRAVLNDPEFRAISYVTFLDSDDILGRDSIERRVYALDDDERVRMVYGHIGECNGSMKMLKKSTGPLFDEPKKIAELLKKRRAVEFPHFTVMLRRALLQEVGEYDENMGYGEDRDFTVRMLRLLNPGEISRIDEILLFSRRHPDGVCGFYSSNGLIPADHAYFDEKHERDFYDRLGDVAHRLLVRPHSLLPEAVKRELRPVRDAVRQQINGEIDPFVAQIEAQTI